MNYLAHGYRFTDDTYFLAGTAVPDWVRVVDRGTRVRSKKAGLFVDDADPVTAAVARGSVRHIRDDNRFHHSELFARLLWQMTVRIRDVLADDTGLRPRMLAHLLIEVMLDASITEERPERLDAYYRALDRIDPEAVGRAVTQFATRPVDRLAEFIPRFSAERFLYDYLDDAKLLIRLNQVMRRLKLPEVHDDFGDVLPEVRQLVYPQAAELLRIVEEQ
jgi:hypothetical protein